MEGVGLSKSRCCCEKKETSGARGGGRLRKCPEYNSGDDGMKTPEKRSISDVGNLKLRVTCERQPCGGGGGGERVGVERGWGEHLIQTQNARAAHSLQGGGG